MINFGELERKIAELPLRLVGDDRFITAHYYVQANYPLDEVAVKVASHQSTARGTFGEGSLLERCSAKVSYVESLAGKNEGLIGLSFPLELLGERIYGGDILHIVSGAVQHDESQHRLFYLRDLEMPAAVLSSLPGPRYGVSLLTEEEKPVFGTIIKPCSGITLSDYERIVGSLVGLDDLKFIKEDENLLPAFHHCPLKERVKVAARIIKRSGKDILFAPHISAPPRQFFENLRIVAEEGLRAVMFSETYYGGLLREARDFVQERGYEIALYAHNGGIGTRTKSINRVLLDRMARLDGADFRQTAPTGESCYLTPLPWQRDLVEQVLTGPSGELKATVCVRAGGLDQGNLLANLYECRGHLGNYLFLMGSAINSVRDERGEYKAAVGMAGIREVISLYQQGVNASDVPSLYKVAAERGLGNLMVCLRQRYADEKLRAPRAVEGYR